MKDDGILIPVDFTEVSENAVSYAIGLAQKLKSKLVFVHAYSVAYPSGTPIGMATMAHNVTDTTASQEKINKENKWKRINFSMKKKRTRYFYVLDVFKICKYSKVNL